MDQITRDVSSRRPQQEFPDLTRHYQQANKPWSDYYFADSVDGAPLSAVKQYIQQKNHPT
jgi:putative transposase